MIYLRMRLSFLDLIDILGTFSFSVSGAFAAMEKKLDPLWIYAKEEIAMISRVHSNILRFGN